MRDHCHGSVRWPGMEAAVEEVAHYFSSSVTICDAFVPFLTQAVEAAIATATQIHSQHSNRGPVSSSSIEPQQLAEGGGTVFDSPDVPRRPVPVLGAVQCAPNRRVLHLIDPLMLRFDLAELADASVSAYELFRSDPLKQFQVLARCAAEHWIAAELFVPECAPSSGVEAPSSLPSLMSHSRLRSSMSSHTWVFISTNFTSIDIAKMVALPHDIPLFAQPSADAPLGTLPRPVASAYGPRRSHWKSSGPPTSSHVLLLSVTGTTAVVFFPTADKSAVISDEYVAITNISIRQRPALLSTQAVVGCGCETAMWPSVVIVNLSDYPQSMRSAMLTPGMRVSFLATLSTLAEFLSQGSSSATYPPPQCIGPPPTAIIAASPYSSLRSLTFLPSRNLNGDDAVLEQFVLRAVAPVDHQPIQRALLTDDLFATYATEAASWREALSMWRHVSIAWAAAPCCTPGWYIPSQHGVAFPVLWAAGMLSAAVPDAALKLCFRVPHASMASELRTLSLEASTRGGEAVKDGSGIRNVLFISTETTEAQLLPSIRVDKTKLPLPCSQAAEVVRMGLLNHVGCVLYFHHLAHYSASVLRTVTRFHAEGHVLVPRSNQTGEGAAHQAYPTVSTPSSAVCGAAPSYSSHIACPVHASIVGVIAATDVAAPSPAVADFVRTSTVAYVVNEPFTTLEDTITAHIKQLDSRRKWTSVGKVPFSDGSSSNRTPWQHLQAILSEETRQCLTLPKLTDSAMHLLERYYSGLRSAFPEAIEVSRIRSLIRLACAHATLRVAWNTPTHLLEAVFSAGVEVFQIDALAAIAITDGSLSLTLDIPMLGLGTLLTAAVQTLRSRPLFDASESGDDNSDMSGIDDFGPFQPLDDGTVASWFLQVQERIVSCGTN